MSSYEWTQVGFWKHPHLSYITFIVFSIIGGLIGLDHLYLRSPITALLKLLSFFILPFFWYLYDIFQATAEKDKFIKYGLTTPIITTSGIGAGMFKTDDSKKIPEEEAPPSPLYFVGFAILGLIPMGFDLFLVGDTKGGLAKLLISLIPILGWLYVGVWTVVNYYELLFKTPKIFTKGVTHFVTPFVDPRFYSKTLGNPASHPEPDKKMSFMDLMRAIWEDIKIYILGAKKKDKDGEETHGFFTAIFLRIRDYLQNKVIAKSPTLQKVAGAAETFAGVAKAAVNTVVEPVMVAGPAVLGAVASAPATGIEAAKIVVEAANDKIKALGPPPMLQRGGALETLPPTATIALVGMLVIVCSLSLGKYVFMKFNTKQERKASEEIPPTRREYLDQNDKLSDEPPMKSAVVSNSLLPAAAAEI